MRDKKFDTFIDRLIRWIGSPASLVLHTILFILSFLLYFLGVDGDTILLALTTFVSLEAIYLAIFIQMSVNKQDAHLGEVGKDVEEIQHDIDEIQEDIEDIEEDEEEERAQDALDRETLIRIEKSLKELGKEVSELRRTKGE